MPFGKYMGVELTEIPESYLRWLRAQPWVGQWLLDGVDGVLCDNPGWSEDADEEEVVVAFSVHDSGGVGRTIVNCDGDIIAWTKDDGVAQVVCRLLNENENLLYKEKEKDHDTYA